MDQLFSYLAKDAECVCAMDDLEAGMDRLKWLGHYLDLYMNVTYGPEDHLRIADCNYEGREFKGISNFAHLYIKTHHAHEDPFTRTSEDPND